MQSPTQRYVERAEKHLATLSPAAARAFLAREAHRWEFLYQQFIAAVDAGRDPGPGTAFDFTETIGAIEILKSKYMEETVS